MDNRDKQLIINRYRERMDKHGIGIETLASGTEDNRLLRYRTLSEVGIFNRARVLDLGCGFADFYRYLKERGMTVDYTGYDINPDFIRICQEKYPEAKFEVKDVQADKINDGFDFVIASQVYNNRLVHDSNEMVMKEVLRKAYDLCSNQGGVAVDMLTDYVDFKEERLHYYSPEEIFSYCKTLTSRVALRHDYPLYEFTVYLYKDPLVGRGQ